MFAGALSQIHLQVEIIEQMFQLIGQRADVSIFESYTARPDRFL